MEKRSNIHVLEVTGGEERQNKSETVFNEKLTEAFPRLIKDTKLRE